ncbi:cytochrome c oxidase subunit 2A [Alkalibacillus salilacus]|uniref:Cytochrome c oxidase subunit 2A n=1 Tax=Alkalibacillus salilacus TaxID=284582 RepID=A0ABT9VBK0_9BACI|nr:cytochrome c oxidase subunit 2A [Alkalibacillus salilacus]MDQ0158270.1 hypothetical protein [Alkalibacillus salilacus]
MANQHEHKTETSYDQVEAGKGAMWASLVFVGLFIVLLWFGIWGLYMIRL